MNVTDSDDPSDFALADRADPRQATVCSAVRIFVTPPAEPLLPSGCRLTVDFADIDWGRRTPRMTTPAFEPSYRVTDAAGAAVKPGEQRLAQWADFANHRFSVPTTDLATGPSRRRSRCWRRGWWTPARASGGDRAPAPAPALTPSACPEG